MAQKRRVALAIMTALLTLPASTLAANLRVRILGAPAARGGAISSLRIVRAGDGTLQATGPLSPRRTVPVSDGVYIVVAEVAGSRPTPALAASTGVVARHNRVPGVRLRLHRVIAGTVSRATGRATARTAAAGGAIVTSYGVVLTGGPGSTQPDINLDGPLDGYLWDALHGDGVRVVDETPQFAVAAVREQILSSQGRLATKFTYDPLSPTFVVRGEGTILRNGKASIELRLTDETGAIVAIAHANGSAKKLRDVVVEAARKLADQARDKLKEAANPTPTCQGSDIRGCYGTDLSVEGIFDQTRGWGSGTVAGPEGHGSVTEGFDSLEHGYVGSWPEGTPFTLTATPSRGSHFDHWSGSCTGTSTTCQLTAKPKLDVTGFFAEDLWTLTVDNQNSAGGEAYGGVIACGERDHTCSGTLRGQTSDADLYLLNVYPEASYMISSLQGCDQFDGSFQGGGNCQIAMTADKKVTVDFVCNPDATTPCAGTGAARDPGSRHQTITKRRS